RALGLPVQTRACDTFGEMTPVRWLQRAFTGMGAGCDHVGAALDELAARSEEALPAGRRARLDNDQRVGGQAPQALPGGLPNLWRQFVKYIGQRDQITWRAVDGV